jgi:lipopolysaccharide export system protein LptA
MRFFDSQTRDRFGSLFSGLVLLAMLAPQPAAVGATGLPINEVNMASDHQTYDTQKHQSFLIGHVNVAYKNYRIKSLEATIDLDEQGNPSLANFYNEPHGKRIDPITKKEDTLDGKIIRVHLLENALSAEGDTRSYVTTVAANPITVKADRQRFDNNAKMVTANGNVIVHQLETTTYSPTATLWMDPITGKAKKAVFEGGARIEKRGSEVRGQKITVMMESGNMIAEQNVRSFVKQQKTTSATPSSSSAEKASATPQRPMTIFSDYQQYDKLSDTVLSSGNVRIFYDDYKTDGPKATFKLKNGQVDRVILTGRSTIVTSDRKITADVITITTNPKHFDAVGNVKTKIMTKQDPTKTEPKATSGGNTKVSAGSSTVNTKPGAKSKSAPPDDQLY